MAWRQKGNILCGTIFMQDEISLFKRGCLSKYIQSLSTVEPLWKGQESLTKVAKFGPFPCTILYKSYLFYPSWQVTSFERPPSWMAFIEGFHCSSKMPYGLHPTGLLATLNNCLPGWYYTAKALMVEKTHPLTHWGWDKMAAISQTILSNPFSWMKMFEFRLRFHWSWFPRVQLTIFQDWFR